jgi:hypothetical protein
MANLIPTDAARGRFGFVLVLSARTRSVSRHQIPRAPCLLTDGQRPARHRQGHAQTGQVPRGRLCPRPSNRRYSSPSSAYPTPIARAPHPQSAALVAATQAKAASIAVASAKEMSPPANPTATLGEASPPASPGRCAPGIGPGQAVLARVAIHPPACQRPPR